MIGFLQKAIAQLQRVFVAEPSSTEPKRHVGRPRKPVEELRASAAKRTADRRKKKAERRTVGQLVKQQDSAGHWHYYVVMEIDAERHATNHEEIARDANGNPRKYANGHWVYLKDVDEPPVLPPSKPPSSAAPAVPAPVVQPAAKPTPGPAPVDNSDSCGAVWASRHGIQDFKPDTTQIFLVNGTANLDAATKMGQLAVTISQWYPNYDAMFLMAGFTGIWIVANRATDESWVRSMLTATPEVRAKMRLCVCTDVPELISLKLAVDDAILRKQPGVTLSSFYGSPERFKSLPQTEEEAKT
jgi:hypothetical protein